MNQEMIKYATAASGIQEQWESAKGDQVFNMFTYNKVYRLQAPVKAFSQIDRIFLPDVEYCLELIVKACRDTHQYDYKSLTRMMTKIDRTYEWNIRIFEWDFLEKKVVHDLTHPNIEICCLMAAEFVISGGKNDLRKLINQKEKVWSKKQ